MLPTLPADIRAVQHAFSIPIIRGGVIALFASVRHKNLHVAHPGRVPCASPRAPAYRRYNCATTCSIRDRGCLTSTAISERFTKHFYYFLLPSKIPIAFRCLGTSRSIHVHAVYICESSNDKWIFSDISIKLSEIFIGSRFYGSVCSPIDVVHLHNQKRIYYTYIGTRTSFSKLVGARSPIWIIYI